MRTNLTVPFAEKDAARHGTWEGRIQLWYDVASQSFLGHEHEQPKAMRFDDITEVEF